MGIHGLELHLATPWHRYAPKANNLVVEEKTFFRGGRKLIDLPLNRNLKITMTTKLDIRTHQLGIVKSTVMFAKLTRTTLIFIGKGAKRVCTPYNSFALTYCLYIYRFDGGS